MWSNTFPKLTVITVFVWTILLISVKCSGPIRSSKRTRIAHHQVDQQHPKNISSIFTAIASKLVRPNTIYNVTLTVQDGGSGAHFQLKIKSTGGDAYYSSNQVQVHPGSSKVVGIPVQGLKGKRYNLTISGFTSDTETKFEYCTVIYKDSKHLSLLIQTDKPVYKPGETIKFRVILLDRFLRPCPGKALDVTISDPNKNIIKIWKNAPVGHAGLLSESLPLSSEPNLGEWSIKVKVLDHHGLTQTHTVSVEQYVLPKFKIEVKLPPFVTRNESKFIAEVKGTYTYGKPLVGSLNVTLSEHFSWTYEGQKIRSSSKRLELKGSAFVQFDIIKDLGMTEVGDYENEFQVLATVTEPLTGKSQNGSSLLRVHKYPYKIEMINTPRNYKPGFPLILQFKVTSQDNVPIWDERPNALRIEHGFAFLAEEGILERPIPTNGIVTIDIPTPTNELSGTGTIEVIYKELKATFYPPSKQVSLSKCYIMLRLESKKVKVNTPLSFRLRLNKHFDSFAYIIYGRGLVQGGKYIKVKGSPVKDHKFKAVIPSSASPEATILVYTTIGDTHEVVADSIKLQIDASLENQLEMKLSKDKAEPGETIDLTLNTRPNSLVALRGIDQSVMIMKEDKDITFKVIEGEINSFQTDLSYSRVWGGSSAFQVFEEAGLVVLTNGALEKEELHYYGGDYYDSGMEMDAEAEAYRGAPVFMASTSVAKMDMQARNGDYGGSRDQVPNIRVRTKFPETWLWEEVLVNDSSTELQKIVPDTLTSWVITGYSLSSEAGIGLSRKPSILQSFRPFFITLNVPYSIIKGETLALQVLVHNYLERTIEAEVTLQNKENQFEFTTDDGEEGGDSEVSKKVEVESGQVNLVTISVKAIKFGIVKIDVKAVSGMAGDALSQPLIVKPPGRKQIQNRALLIDLRKKSSYSESLRATFPKNRIKGADEVKFSVISDLLGSTISNLDNLIQMPCGCGEQNMLNFVPDIVILQYLESSGSLTEEIKSKALRFLETGYQRELTYRHTDGSFSAFGNSDPHGSTWLTAFVLRSFIAAKPYITIDENVLRQGLRFLADSQVKEGRFEELGKVLHSGLEGGSAQGSIALSAYVILAFIEANKANVSEINFEDTIQLGLQFITRHDKGLDAHDPYTLSLVTHVLHASGHKKKNHFLNKLEGLATKTSELTFWEPKKGKPTSEDGKVRPHHDKDHNPKPVSIEMTAYNLQTYLLRKDLDKALPIAKWLLLQRNSEGGFVSTQDTVVGLSALAKFALITRDNETEMSVTLKHGGKSEEFKVDTDNSMTLQEAILPPTTRKVKVEGEGKGTALAQLAWSYYVEEEVLDQAFELKVKVKQHQKSFGITLTVCVKYPKMIPSNMAVLQVNAPSGFTLDSDRLEEIMQIEKVKRGEFEDRNTRLEIYFESLNSTKSCVNLAATKMFEVSNPANAYVEVYDYYETTLRSRKFYNYVK